MDCVQGGRVAVLLPDRSPWRPTWLGFRQWHLPVRGSDVPGGGGRGFRIRAKPLGPYSGQPAASGSPGRRAGCLLSMISPASWWWPNRPPQVPTAWTARLLAGLGVVLFGASALLVKAGTISWDARLFRILNQVPPTVASVLTPLSHLFLPTGIIAVVVLTVVYAVARNRSVLPVAAAAVAAGAAWVLAHVAKAIADRPRPYEVMAGTVLRQQPAHGTSFPSRRCWAVRAGQRTTTTQRPIPRPPTPAPSPTVSHNNSGIAPEGRVFTKLPAGHQTLNPAFAGPAPRQAVTAQDPGSAASVRTQGALHDLPPRGTRSEAEAAP